MPKNKFKKIVREYAKEHNMSYMGALFHCLAWRWSRATQEDFDTSLLKIQDMQNLGVEEIKKIIHKQEMIKDEKQNIGRQ